MATIRYLSLFSGIEACSVAWEPLGWECAGVAELEPFPCAVLAHHYPSVPNLGDVTKITPEQIEQLGHIDLVVGGSPCQDLSVAGKRRGFSDDDGNTTRSGLFFEQLRIFDIARKRCGARFLLWENVVGAYSSSQGADFAAVVSHMAGLDGVEVPKGGWAKEGAAVGDNGLLEWACLDAQWFGVAQRRRRVFACLDTGDWSNRPPVLLVTKGLLGNSPPSRDAGKGLAAFIEASVKNGGREGRDSVVTDASPVVSALPLNTMTMQGRPSDLANPRMGSGIGEETDPCPTLTKAHSHAVFEVHGFYPQMKVESQTVTKDLSPCLVNGTNPGYQNGIFYAETVREEPVDALCIHENQRAELTLNATMGALKCAGGKPGQGYPAVLLLSSKEAVREEPVDAARMVAFGEYASDGTASCMKARDYKDATDLISVIAVPESQGLPVSVDFRNGSIDANVTSTLQAKSTGGYSLNYMPGVIDAVPTERIVQGFDEVARTLTARHDSSPCSDRGMDVVGILEYDPAIIAFSGKDYGGDAVEGIAPTMRSMCHAGSHANGGGQLAIAYPSAEHVGSRRLVMRVRRLTVTEAERLQGFPDDYTLIPWKGKEPSACPDGPRYKALGNSMAVPVMGYIGRQIQQAVDYSLNPVYSPPSEPAPISELPPPRVRSLALDLL